MGAHDVVVHLVPEARKGRVARVKVDAARPALEVARRLDDHQRVDRRDHLVHLQPQQLSLAAVRDRDDDAPSHGASSGLGQAEARARQRRACARVAVGESSVERGG